ncbi:vacuolar protein sorting-associated protein 18, partial [Lecanoromycetidae sp. Uapishka_2]
MEELEESLPVFKVERVQLQFSISSDFVAAQVANNVLVLALSTGRILRIDLDSPSDIDDIDLPKKTSEIGLIRRMFLDPSASHLIITTTLGENYYLHTQSRQPKPLSRLKGVGIECIAWNPSIPTASTREILVGATDGNVYEDYIEPSSEFYRSQEKYLKAVYKVPDGPISGLWVDLIPGKSDIRRVIVASPTQILHFVGRIGRHGQEGSGSIFTRLFETEVPTLHEVNRGVQSSQSALVVSPDSPDAQSTEIENGERTYAWLSAQGVLHGRLRTTTASASLGNTVFNNSKMISRSQIPASENASGRKRAVQDSIAGVALSQWHVLCLVEGRIVAFQRLDERIVYDQVVLEAGDTALGLLADQKKNTHWLFTTQDIFEIVVTDEDRDVWKIMLKSQQFGLASQYAKTPSQKDAVAMASGDHLIGKGRYLEAANVYGKSSRPFEQVALTFIDHGEQDALRRYLLTKLTTYKKSSIMQRTMITSWLVEIFMSKLNSLDDTITTKAQLTEKTNTAETKDELATIRKEFQDFVIKYKTDLDRETTYEIISSHGREQELLSYATAIDDYNYVLSYWVQRERWQESLDVLKKQSDPSIFYRYGSVLMVHAPTELVDILMRHSDLDPLKLIPALLNYNKTNPNLPLEKNQAVRYLLFTINALHTTTPAIHNTLISIYASHPSPSENALLSYLSTHSLSNPPPYDTDFAFRLCIQHARVQSAVHIYTSMGSYASAVDLALKYNEIDLASLVADRPSSSTDAPLRKRLWLAVAKKVISQQGTGSIKTAIDFLKRCDLLRIEDLIPFFPDFVVIDDFKDEICTALESYSRSIASLEQEMDASAATAESIKSDIKQLDRRYAIVEPGERCRVCELPLLSRQFFVFPSCQHGFHSDCLGKKVLDGSGLTVRGRIRELQAQIGRGGRREKEGRELDALVAGQCILCGDIAIKSIEEPFVSDADDGEEWAI